MIVGEAFAEGDKGGDEHGGVEAEDVKGGEVEVIPGSGERRKASLLTHSWKNLSDLKYMLRLNPEGWTLVASGLIQLCT